ncbi:hypothetical protein IV102_36505 [bacterium]|nr:hypothetical protein [bacterium]
MSEMNSGQPDGRQIEKVNFVANYRRDPRHLGRMTFPDLSMYLFTFTDNARFFLILHDRVPMGEPQTLAYNAQ